MSRPSRLKAALAAGLMLASALMVLVPVPGASAGRATPDDWISTYSAINDTTVYIGDQDRTFTITVYNYKWEANDFDDTIYNVTLDYKTVEATDGSPFSDPFSWDADKDMTAYTISAFGSRTSLTFKFDVKGDAKPKTYRLSFTVAFDYRTGPFGSINRGDAAVEEYLYITVVTNFVQPIPRAVPMSEYNSPLSYLYAGKTFQKIAFPFRPVSSSRSPIYNLTYIIQQVPSGLSFTYQSSRSSDPVYYGGNGYLYFRIDIPKTTAAGKYTVVGKVTYNRQDSATRSLSIAAIEEDVKVDIVVDFTPLLNVSSVQPSSFMQGLLSTPLDVTFKNDGNVLLRNMRIYIDIWNYFEQSGYYFRGDGGSKVVQNPEQVIEALDKEQTRTLSYRSDVFKFLPGGKHRLPVRFTGYYYNDGTTVGQTDYVQVTEATYQAITTQTLYVEVEVIDPLFDLRAEGASSLSPSTKSKDVTLSVTLRNLESVDLLYVIPSLLVKPKGSTQDLFINPRTPGAATIDLPEISRLYGGSTNYLTFNVDLSTAIAPGAYTAVLNVNGVNANTKMPVNTTLEMPIRVNPPGPKVTVGSVVYKDSSVKPGKTFPLTLYLRNDGLDQARDVYVRITNVQTGALLALGAEEPSGVAEAESAVNPFIPQDSSLRYIPIIEPTASTPGGGKNTTNTTTTYPGTPFTINMTATRQMILGKPYQKLVVITYRDSFGNSYSASEEITIQSRYQEPEPKDTWAPVRTATVSGFSLTLIVWFFVILGFVVMGWLAKRRLAASAMAQQQVVQEVPLPPPAAVEAVPQAYPAYGQQAQPGPQQQPAYAQPQMPQPAPPPRVGPPGKTTAYARPSKTCPRCNVVMDASLLRCPQCGTNL